MTELFCENIYPFVALGNMAHAVYEIPRSYTVASWCIYHDSHYNIQTEIMPTQQYNRPIVLTVTLVTVQQDICSSSTQTVSTSNLIYP